jgi:hypothetical protein
MKITLIADIHGNLPALEAVLRHALSQNAAQTILNLGDLTGYGPFPEQVVRWSKNNRTINILGNYDKKVLSKFHRKSGWEAVKNEDKRAMFAWTYRALSKSSLKYLRSLPETRLVKQEGINILMTHGSPESISEHLGPNTPEDRFASLAENSNADIILFGHSHQPFSKEVKDVLFINPGSVGRLDDGDPRASYAVLELDQGEIAVEFFRVSYDIMSAVRAIRFAGLPEVFAQVIRQGLNYNDVQTLLGDYIKNPPLEPNGTLTLLTDFGIQDHFVGVMKGVISDIGPQIKTIDISHQVRPQNIHHGARMLTATVPYFSPGTVHVAVVDPGVGTDRRAIAAQIGDHFFVTPDNGLLTPLLKEAKSSGKQIEIFRLVQSKYWLPDPSTSFHGRDIFAPVGAHLANGLPINKLGERIEDPVLLEMAEPKQKEDGWVGEVVIVDVFGNLSTNLSSDLLNQNFDGLVVTIKNERIQGLTKTFGDAKPGELIATIDSSGFLAISVVNGNASQMLEADIGTRVQVISKGESF